MNVTGFHKKVFEMKSFHKKVNSYDRSFKKFFKVKGFHEKYILNGGYSGCIFMKSPSK